MAQKEQKTGDKLLPNDGTAGRREIIRKEPNTKPVIIYIQELLELRLKNKPK